MSEFDKLLWDLIRDYENKKFTDDWLDHLSEEKRADFIKNIEIVAAKMHNQKLK